MSAVTTRALLSDALNLAPSDIGETTSLDTCDAWDSLAHFRVIAAIEGALGRPLSAQEIFDVTDYGSVETLLLSGRPE